MPLSQEDSTAVPSQRYRLYWTVRVSVAATVAPSPLMSVWATSVVGAAVATGVTVGVPSSASVTVGRPAGGVTVFARGACRDRSSR